MSLNIIWNVINYYYDLSISINKLFFKPMYNNIIVPIKTKLYGTILNKNRIIFVKNGVEILKYRNFCTKLKNIKKTDFDFILVYLIDDSILIANSIDDIPNNIYTIDKNLNSNVKFLSCTLNINNKKFNVNIKPFILKNNIILSQNFIDWYFNKHKIIMYILISYCYDIIQNILYYKKKYIIITILLINNSILYYLFAIFYCFLIYSCIIYNPHYNVSNYNIEIIDNNINFVKLEKNQFILINDDNYNIITN
jgi:hypothetical protein